MTIITEGDKKDDDEASSFQAALHLHAGQAVWLQSTSDAVNLYSLLDIYNIFTGVLITPDL